MPGIVDLIAGFISGAGDTAVKIRTAITGIDPAKQAELTALAANLEAQAKQAQVDLDKAQIDLNKTEAASPRLFVSGWRPFIGWTCGAIFAYNYIVRPLVLMIPGIPDLPSLNLEEVTPVLLGMLGLGGMRTYEKIKGAAGNH